MRALLGGHGFSHAAKPRDPIQAAPAMMNLGGAALQRCIKAADKIQAPHGRLTATKPVLFFENSEDGLPQITS
jgi:hypothetical protein